MVAFVGIGVIALPTGILAAAFSDALQRENLNRNKDIKTTFPADPPKVED
jgi:hypothetical protein